MKSQSIYSLLVLFFAVLVTFSLNAQDDVSADSTGYPGDGFSLEGALELFKKSKSPEDFEKLLNSDDNYVNNLDLNEDGEVDYIRVIDNMDDKAHAIILQVPLNEKESQDVAVIGIEEQGKENAILQIVGDADVYGEETYVEPFDEEAKGDGKGGPSANARIARIVVNVYFWPCVRYVYRPSYVVYVSPWRWHYYPSYWRPWRPHPWHVCHTRRVVYHRHYRHVHTHRVVHAHKVYTPHRRTSTTVHARTTSVKAVKGPRGNVAVKKTTATKKVTTTNKKANTANRKSSVANDKASTANKKANTANKKASTANKKTKTANKKASTANKAAAGSKTTTTKAAKTKNGKAATRTTTTKSKAAQTNKRNAAGNKSAKPRNSPQKSAGKGKVGGGKKRGN